MTRAARRVASHGESGIGRMALERELAGFLPSLEGLEKEMQEIAAMLECTDAEFLPEAFRARVQEQGGRERLQHRFLELIRKEFYDQSKLVRRNDEYARD